MHTAGALARHGHGTHCSSDRGDSFASIAGSSTQATRLIPCPSKPHQRGGCRGRLRTGRGLLLGSWRACSSSNVCACHTSCIRFDAMHHPTSQAAVARTVLSETHAAWLTSSLGFRAISASNCDTRASREHVCRLEGVPVPLHAQIHGNTRVALYGRKHCEPPGPWSMPAQALQVHAAA